MNPNIPPRPVFANPPPVMQAAHEGVVASFGALLAAHQTRGPARGGGGGGMGGDGGGGGGDGDEEMADDVAIRQAAEG